MKFGAVKCDSVLPFISLVTTGVDLLHDTFLHIYGMICINQP